MKVYGSRQEDVTEEVHEDGVTKTVVKERGIQSVANEIAGMLRGIRGAVHRLRPKLMTEGTTIIGLVPMLWATGVGAEVMRPRAAPVLGGLLVADEVIDRLLPVIYNWYQCRRWRRIHAEAPAST